MKDPEAFQAARGRVIAALAARFRDLDIAEDAFAEACLKAASAWPARGAPDDETAWLYRTAYRCALDALRRRKVRGEAVLDEPPAPPTPEDAMIGADDPIPDERLRLIFICCHPALAAEARAALTLKLVCGLSTERLARAFLTTEPTMLQRITRAKRKIRDAGVPFETPGPELWAERLEAVLATLEIAYAQAYEDAAGAEDAAEFAVEVLRLSGVLAELLPDEPEVLGLAALVRLTEARRPARLASDGAMIPLSEQDERLWDARLIAEGARLLDRAERLGRSGPCQVMAAIHACHAARQGSGRTDWPVVLGLYDALIRARPTAVAAVNRCVALAEAEGPEAGLGALAALGEPRLQGWRPFHAARAGLLERAGRRPEAMAALQRALELSPPPAERIYLSRKLLKLQG